MPLLVFWLSGFVKTWCGREFGFTKKPTFHNFDGAQKDVRSSRDQKQLLKFVLFEELRENRIDVQPVVDFSSFWFCDFRIPFASTREAAHDSTENETSQHHQR